MTFSSETVFQGTIEQAPPHLSWFVQQLPPDVQHLILRPSGQLFGGKRLYFNERIVLPGQNVVAAGRCERGPHGVRLVPTGDAGVSLGFGTLQTERARVAKLPIAGELFGAVVAGGIACALVEMILSITFKG